MSRMMSRLLGALLLASPWVAHAQAPALLPVQGYVSDSMGAPLDGSFNVTLTLYNVSTPSEPEDPTEVVHREVHLDQAVSTGFFTMYIGDGTPLAPTTSPLDLGTFLAEGTLHLGIQVGSEAEARPLLPVATAPYAAFAQYCGDADTVGGAPLSELAMSTHTHSWSDITSGMPAGFADGVDNDSGGDITSVTGGFGITASGCDSGDCMMSVDVSVLQRRIVGSCGPGASIRAIDDTGSVTCEPDDDTQNTNASNLSTGTLSVDRYSAIDDLFAEGVMDASSPNDIVSIGTGDARYLSSMGGTLTGGLAAPSFIVDNEYQYAMPRSGYVAVPCADFAARRTDDDSWHTGVSYCYYADAGEASLYAHVRVPDAATVTGIDCQFQDTTQATGQNVSMIGGLYARSWSAQSATEYYDISASTIDLTGSAILTEVGAELVAPPNGGNGDRFWVIALNWNPAAAGQNFRFFGCRVSYTTSYATY